jgi:hypothetical protein
MMNKLMTMTNKMMVTATQALSNTKAMKLMSMLLVAGAVVAANVNMAAAAAQSNFNSIVQPIVGLLSKFVTPMLMIVGAGGVLFCIVLGVKYATAEEPQEREKRKQALKTAIIGYVLIFVLIVALKLSIGPLTTWMNESLQGAQSAPEVKLDGK